MTPEILEQSAELIRSWVAEHGVPAHRAGALSTVVETLAGLRAGLLQTAEKGAEIQKSRASYEGSHMIRVLLLVSMVSHSSRLREAVDLAVVAAFPHLAECMAS
eukprot:3625794-Alexandrium_andersonii.AAC.1